jgi:hypothetical protein
MRKMGKLPEKSVSPKTYKLINPSIPKKTEIFDFYFFRGSTKKYKNRRFFIFRDQ